MNSKYVQFPPLPRDTPIEFLDLLWLYAKMSKKHQKILLDFVKLNPKNDTENLNETKFLINMLDSESGTHSEFTEFNNYMKQIIGTLIVQACEMAALVYQNYCIENKSVDEISNEFSIDEGTILLMANFYDKTNSIKE